MKKYLLIMLVISACSTNQQSMKNQAELYDYDVEERLLELGIELGAPATPVANYVNAVQSGNLVFMSGAGPRKPDGVFITGKVGVDVTAEEGYAAARQTAIVQLAALRDLIGDLNRVERIIKVTGMVNADPAFTQHSAVINGFSDLLVEVFGDRGKHARAAVGMGSLPLNLVCEIEMIVQVSE